MCWLGGRSFWGTPGSFRGGEEREGGGRAVWGGVDQLVEWPMEERWEGGGVAGANEALEVGQTWHMCGSLGGKGEGGSKRRGSCFQGMLEGGYAGGAYI
jgi:hypothetical protein